MKQNKVYSTLISFSYFALIIGFLNFIDGAITYYALTHNLGEEANPLFQGMASNPLHLLVLKIVISLLFFLYAIVLRVSTHKFLEKIDNKKLFTKILLKYCTVLCYLITIGYIFVIIHNLIIIL